VSSLTSALRPIDPIDEVPDADPQASGTALTASWRVEVLRPSREVTIRVRRRNRSARSTAAEPDYRARALALWPRLDPVKLRRTKGEVMRIARLVERRTACSIETIVGMLTRDDGAARDG